MKRIFTVFTLSVSLIASSNAQTSYEAALDAIDAQHQDCLDNSDDMIACAGNYYKTLDSMMAVVLKAAIKQTPGTEKMDLRTEQKEWNDARILKFREIDDNAKTNGDDKSVALENKAAILRERVEELTRRLD